VPTSTIPAFFTGRMPFLPPNRVKAPKATSAFGSASESDANLDLNFTLPPTGSQDKDSIYAGLLQHSA